MPRPVRHPRRPRVELLETRQLLATFVVSNTNDTGAGSLRQALLDSTADFAASTPFTTETINFAIGGTGPQTITPATPLPAVKFPITIDGTTQPGYAGKPLIVLDGVNATSTDGSLVAGLDLESGAFAGSKVSGLEIVRFSGSGVVSNDFGTAFDQMAIGTDPTGAKNLGNGQYGILFPAAYGQNSVSNSIIANNGSLGIGQPQNFGNYQSSQPYYTTDNVTQTNNATAATTLVVSTPAGTYDDYNVAYGSTQTLTYTVTNTGSKPATDVIPTIHEGPDQQFGTILSVTTSQGKVIWNQDPNIEETDLANFGTLAPGASATVTVVVQIRAAASQVYSSSPPGAIFNVTVRSPEETENPITNQALYTLTPLDDGTGTPVVPPGTTTLPIIYVGPIDTTGTPVSSPTVATPYVAPDIAVTASAPASATIGQPTTLTFHVTNSGGNSQEVDVTLDLSKLPAVSTFSIDRINPNPEFATLLAVNGSSFGAASLISGTYGQYKLNLGPINAGASADVNVTVYLGQGGDISLGPIDGGPIGSVTPPAKVGDLLPVIVAASDSSNSVADPTPSNNATLAVVPVVAAALQTPADLKVSAVGATPTYLAGQASSLLFEVTNSGGDASDAVVTFDLTGLPAGSVATLVPLPIPGTSTGTIFNGPLVPALTPVPGHPGLYQADLHRLNAGSTEELNLSITPGSGQALAFQVSANDAGATQPDPTPLNNMVLISAPLTAATPTSPTTPATVTGRTTVQADLTTVLPRAQVQKLAHYQLSTVDGTTVPIRSVQYNSRTHKVTLRLAHPLPVGTTQVRLTVTGLGSGLPTTTAQSVASKARHR